MATSTLLGTTTVALDVHGMTCESCERHVAEALATVPGVSEVRVSLTSGTATAIWAIGVPDVQALVDAIRAAGYDAKAADACSTF